MANTLNTMFQIDGPFEVPTHKSAVSKLVAEDTSSFWSKASSLKNKIGCYVFAIRAGRGMTPLYVGKTTNSFEKECFTDHKIKHYNYALAEYSKGTPIMFFVEYQKKKGKVNSADITDLEDFLIQVGRRINPNLRNIKGAKEPTWGIKGVIRGGKGKKNKPETAFCSVFGI